MSESTDSPRHAIGLSWASMVGYGLILVGAILMLLDRRSKWETGQHYVLLESLQIPFLLLGASLIGLGLIAFLLFKWVPGTSKERWPELSIESAQEATILNTMVYTAGAILLPGGLLAGATLYHLDMGHVAPAIALAASASTLGSVFFLWGIARKSLLRRVLARALEIHGAPGREPSQALDENLETAEAIQSAGAENTSEKPGTDPRIAVVLPALDALLENIPEEALENFKGSEAAKFYLEMLSELGE